MHVIKFSALQNHSTLPLVVRAAALLFRLRRVALTSRIICSRIALRRCPARSGSLYPPLAALTSGAPKSKEKSRRLPIFPGRLQPSIFGTTELNFCVRNGNRWDLCVIGTGYGCFHPLFSFEGYTFKTEQRTLLWQIGRTIKDVVKPSTY